MNGSSFFDYFARLLYVIWDCNVKIFSQSAPNSSYSCTFDQSSTTTQYHIITAINSVRLIIMVKMTYTSWLKLAPQTAIVTGAGSGIGKAVAIALANQGWVMAWMVNWASCYDSICISCCHWSAPNLIFWYTFLPWWWWLKRCRRWLSTDVIFSWPTYMTMH